MGFEIKNVDLGSLDDQTFKEKIWSPLMECAAVVLRNQQLTPEQLVSLGRRFGRLEKHFLSDSLLPGFDEILLLSNIKENGKLIGRPNTGECWHADSTFTPNPNRFSLLYSLEVPVNADGVVLGNTLFKSSVDAYDTLPEDVKKRLVGLRAQHYQLWFRRRHGDEEGIELTDAQRKKMENVTHPVVGLHPNTGRKFLYVNRGHTVRIAGMDEQESEELLEYLYNHIEQQPTYVHRWQVGDLLIWDNLAGQHLAASDYEWPLRRCMYRLSVAGEVATMA
ncbi:MAG: TauD/TfdA dioxygenase family protein [Burkholderiaceae bacterium]